MKKFILSLLIILSACALALAGCADKEEKSVFAEFEEAYSKVAEATLVEQNNEIKEGALVVYAREKKYEKSQDGFSVTVKEKRLNPLSADKPYTETETQSQAQAGEFAGNLKLTEENFENYEIKNGKLTAVVKSGEESKVFTGSDLQGVKDMTLELELQSGKLVSIKICFTRAKNETANYDCTIAFAFTY